MTNTVYNYGECLAHCGFDYLPGELEQFYEVFPAQSQRYLVEREFLHNCFECFQVDSDSIEQLLEAVVAVEEDPVLFHFTKFLVWDMCSERNRFDGGNYRNMTPKCMKVQRELYSFVLLLACVKPSIEKLQKLGVPEEAYKEIPLYPMKGQFEKLAGGDKKVSDFPWDRNFYTCSIFLLDRFFFIPYRFGDPLTMFRNKETKRVKGLRHEGEEFRRDGQINGVNGVFDKEGAYFTNWKETKEAVTANPVNPMGFVERKEITLSKSQWEEVLGTGDNLLAVHVPSGEGYNPIRLHNSLTMALAFFDRYFPELHIKGFWSESWLYDPRLSLILTEESSNIIKVQRQMYLYPIKEGDGMLRYEVFGDWKAEPEKIERKTSLQKAAAAYMSTGGRFHTTSMLILREEAGCIEDYPYIAQADVDYFHKIADSHLK
jgi:hypothetical protein